MMYRAAGEKSDIEFWSQGWPEEKEKDAAFYKKKYEDAQKDTLSFVELYTDLRKLHNEMLRRSATTYVGGRSDEEQFDAWVKRLEYHWGKAEYKEIAESVRELLRIVRRRYESSNKGKYLIETGDGRWVEREKFR